VHIGIAAFGTWGDVEPFTALAAALRADGHRVTWFVEPSAAAAITGDAVVPVGPALDAPRLLRDPRALDPRFVWREVYAPRIAPFHDALRARHRVDPIDGVAAHVWTLGASLAADRLGVPFASVALQPMVWMSRARPPRLDALELPPWLYARAFALVEPVIMRGLLGRSLRAEAKKLGIRDRALSVRALWSRAACHLGLWDPSFRGPQPDDPPRAHVVGFVAPDHLAAEDDLVRFCEARSPWIVGLGSTLPTNHQRPYALALDAVREPLLLIGARLEVPPALRDRVRVTPRAPYGALFGHARGVIHHGGVGTTAHALRAGVPQCVLAFGNDMFDNGECLRAMGVGEVLVGADASRGVLLAALERLRRPEVQALARSRARDLVTPAEAVAAATRVLERAFEAPPRR
jgi:UDP:flavonoid glycosyltransferase YjiC (YdhE family)